MNQADPLRLDVTVPGEQHFYLRASTSQERQQWLVALGSAKACEGLTTKETISEQGNQTIHIYDLSRTHFFLSLVYISIPEERDSLKSKRSELRLYCDLLMQQVHSVKDAATQAPPDVEVKVNSNDCNLKYVSQITFITETGRINALANGHLRHFYIDPRRVFAACQSRV